MKERKRIFITGATGFIGANLARTFLSQNYEIHLLLRRGSDTWRINDIRNRLIIHTGDLHDIASLKRIIHRVNPSYIFHLAAYGAYSFQTDFDSMVKTNITGTVNLLHASMDIPYVLFVNAGSSSEYGFKRKPMKESDLLEPNSYYSATKASATLLATTFAQKENKPVVTFRFFSVYGPYEDKTRLVPTALLCALHQKPLSITAGNVQRDFIYIEDVMNAFAAAMRKKLRYGEVINIGTGKQYNNLNVASIVKKLNHGELTIQKGAFPNRNWDSTFWVADTARARKILRWQSHFSLEKGLSKTFDWFRKNSLLYEKI